MVGTSTTTNISRKEWAELNIIWSYINTISGVTEVSTASEMCENFTQYINDLLEKWWSEEYIALLKEKKQELMEKCK